MQTIPRYKRRESVLISGGFPCTDASKAKYNGKGIYGDKTGEGWREMYRIIREVRPEYVFVENVPNLLRRGWGKVIEDFSTAQYNVWWHVIPAKNFGFPFEGERIYAIAFEASIFGWEAIQRFETLHHPAGTISGDFWTTTYPKLCRIDNGLSGGAHRIAALGNACIPLFPEIILTALNEFDNTYFNPRPQ